MSLWLLVYNEQVPDESVRYLLTDPEFDSGYITCDDWTYGVFTRYPLRNASVRAEGSGT